ncbi:MAG: hypothetical protein WKF30_09570 [Pyrinomonadaceae bacterium]
MSSQSFEVTEAHERECAHRKLGVKGQFFAGDNYVQSLMSLRATAASQVAKNVTPFFWADAARVKVWLCQDCAGKLSLY